MNFFKKKIKAIANGTIVSLETIPDEVFSSKMMGNGFAIVEHDGRIYAPVKGKIKSIFPTKHAITITSNQGIDILIHMGLDTVDLKGSPFSIKVKEGQEVSQSSLIAVMNMQQLTDYEKNSTVIVVMPEIQQGTQLKDNEAVTIGESVFSI